MVVLAPRYMPMIKPYMKMTQYFVYSLKYVMNEVYLPIFVLA